MVTSQFFDKLPADAAAIREAVFMREQGFHNEFDSIDNISLHLVVYVDGIPAGAARMFPSEGRPQVCTLGRVAVLPQYRGLQLGNYLLACLERRARELGIRRLELSAQCRVRPFYERNGYTASGDVYLDEYCEHIHMEKVL